MERRSEQRVQVLNEIEQTLETYCSDCFVYRYHRKDFGRTHAHKFCLSSCTVGSGLKELGDRLQKNKE